MKIEDIKDREIMVAFGREQDVCGNRVLVVLRDGNGTTFYAGDKGIEQAPLEPVSCGVTPGFVKCIDGTINSQRIMLQLGRNRFFSSAYMGKEDLHTVYLPDERDLEQGTSEFMQKCGGRGLM